MKHMHLAIAASLALLSGAASADPVTFTKLTGLTGGTLGQTAVYVSDLSTLSFGTVSSITISDNSSGLGGAGGQFSGFDLDAIKLSTTLCADAACAKGLSGLPVFDFTGATFFSPGTQRAPADPKLFGTDAPGTAVDDTVATLGEFDGEATTAIPGAFGFLSMGDNGVISFNLTSAVSTAGTYLYIGEVGDNGEVAASSISANENSVPEPTPLVLLGSALFALAAVRRRRA
jgi:hypothetical protein